MINEDYIFLEIEIKTKEELFRFISKQAEKFKITNNQELLYQDFLDRESQCTTGLADGFAIPHARSDNVNKVAVMFLRTKQTLDWESLDNQPVDCAFALMVPSLYDGQIHLQMISTLATCLLEDDFKNTIRLSNNKEGLNKFLNQKIKEELE